ncbi:MAG: alpha amylase catalytic region, partial [Acidobacteria bacterium]|nr:alpha amylase catalytic region [Acidobacteriota bacterium]
MNSRPQEPVRKIALVLVLLLMSAIFPALAKHAIADHTPDPSSVTIVGSLQSELGCAGDWDPGCAVTHLAYDAADDVWQNIWMPPAGSFEYKAAINDSWSENYGANAQQGGSNIALTANGGLVKFYYDHKSHWVTDNKNSIIAVAPGSFQSELGCPVDWDPGCLRSWLQDPDGDGIHTFTTTALPAGSYEGKVALDESWDVNYGSGGVQNGPNIQFTVPVPNTTVTFSYDSTTHLLAIAVDLPQPQPDNNVEWDGLRHDSRDLLYRAPGGAVPAGTPVTIRFRTFHNDVTGVALRVYSQSAAGESLIQMAPTAVDVSCYQTGFEGSTCDYWAATLPNASADNLWYRFIVTDGTDVDYYADNTAALDGGLGSPKDDDVALPFALMVYKPGFTAPSWTRQAFIYQIFPDRYRDGRNDNKPQTGDPRYDDPVLKLPWGTLPEGYCRNYADGSTNCPWRFDDTPPADSPIKEQPRGRDYYGGDLKGADQYLDYLKSLGVNALYFNPLFDAASNHSYDTQDYFAIDPYFGSKKDWDNLVKHANQRGMKLVLDGVFNHLSSDSPFFDRYGHYAAAGACESIDSPYRSWFYFHDVPAGTGPCVSNAGELNSATYDSWFGFDSIPVINKTIPEVQQYFLSGSSPDSVSKYWLKQGASGWRMDVMTDLSFPDGYWESFRGVVKTTKNNANYRLRDAVIGLLAPGPFDSKGFADSGRVIMPSEFASRIQSIREDYPDAAYFSLMNLIDSHDTERALWTLTPGTETRGDKEFNAANLAAGKQRLKIASMIQFTMPGAPSIFYGDEVGLTGDDDPDNRRTYPWADQGGAPDINLFAHYRTLASLRGRTPALTDGGIRFLLADDAANIVAYGRNTDSQAALVVVNRGSSDQTIPIPFEGYLPEGTVLQNAYNVGIAGPSSLAVSGGQVTVNIGANSAWLLITGGIDLRPTDAPGNLRVTNEGNAEVSLGWNSVAGAAGYNIYRSPVPGGGYVKLNAGPLAGLSFTDTGLRNAQSYFYVVNAVDAAGNQSAYSNEVNALPHLMIGWANLQWPPTLTHTISAVNRTDNVYGQVWINGVTSQPGPADSLRAQLGFGPQGTNPATNPGWLWLDAGFHVDAGNNDEFIASLLPETSGVFDYGYRYTTTNGRDWVYADLNGPSNLPFANPGKLTVNPSGDTTAPAAPAGLRVVASSPSGIQLAWDAVAGDPTLFGYEILRGDAAGGPYAAIAMTTDVIYADAAVAEFGMYYYVVRSVDLSFNRSGYSNEIAAVAELRTVTVTFNVTVPATTDSTGRSVYIAGFLDRLDGGLPQWDPAGVVLTRVDSTHWTVTLTGSEGTQIEYKYTLGSWDYVEKDNSCGEIANRSLTLSYGATGTQAVNDTVLNWRNIAP